MPEFGGSGLPRHATTHEDGGSDEISLLGLEIPAHVAQHEDGGSDVLSVLDLPGLLADEQTPLTHGPDKHTDRTRSLFFMGAYQPSARWDSLNAMPIISMRDGQNDTFYGTVRIPEDYVSDHHFYAVWACASVSGNMYWSVTVQWGLAGESYINTQYTSAYAAQVTAGANIINVSEFLEASEMAAIGALDFVSCRIRRDATDAADTLNDKVGVLGFLLTYTGDQ